MNTFYCPRFITMYIFTALFFGLLLCWIVGFGASELVKEGLVDLESGTKPDPDFLFGIAPMFLCMGSPLIAFGLIVLTTVWFMRKWGIVLAIVLHLVGISFMIYMVIHGLLDGSLNASLLVLDAILLVGIIAQIYFIYWFVRHWSLFRWIKFTSPDSPQIADNP